MASAKTHVDDAVGTLEVSNLLQEVLALFSDRVDAIRERIYFTDIALWFANPKRSIGATRDLIWTIPIGDFTGQFGSLHKFPLVSHTDEVVN